MSLPRQLLILVLVCCHHAVLPPVRSQDPPPLSVVTYEDVVTYKDRPEVLLVDVREPDEINNTGIIPASINIPNPPPDSVVTYEDVVTYKDRPEVLLVDVREPDEIKNTGRIPASINIPMAELPNALQLLNNDEFKEKFHRDLPSKDTEIVFTCRSGRRATRAMKMARNYGFTNTKVYLGSWLDWASKTQALE